MTVEYPPVTFGAFLGPYHLPNVDSNWAIHYNLDIIEHLDALGFAEAWVIFWIRRVRVEVFQEDE